MSYHEPPVFRILVAVDFSAHARLALEWALRLAKAMNGRLVLLHVIDIFSLAQASCRMVGTDYLGILRDDASRGMDELQKLVPEAERFIREGSPRPLIIDTAVELNCQMIVMGTHGRSGLAHLLLGSVAEYVVRHSQIPVLTAHCPKPQ